MTENDILRICSLAGYRMGDLAYGGVADGNYYVIYGQAGKSDAEIECTGAPIILVVRKGHCRVATDEEWSCFYENLVED